jgi:haloalkane dehalogenase
VGWHAFAPDLAGFGDSEPDPPGTWERHVEAIDRFRRELGIERCALIVHDWGGLIGLRWACDHPDAVRSSSARPGSSPTASGTAWPRRCAPPARARRWWPRSIAPPSADEERRRGQLELYRSGDFEQLSDYRLADLGVFVLVLWGEQDQFAPVAGAHRFVRELPDTQLVVIAGAGHFVWDEAPEACAAALTAFLARIRSSSDSST